MKRLTTVCSLITSSLALALPAWSQTGLYQVNTGATATTYVAATAYTGEKIPLVVVHGLNNSINSTEIKALTDSLATDAKISNYFQVFTLEYDTFATIDSNGALLAQQIAQLIGKRPFVLVGDNMGGLVARAALELHNKDVAGLDLMSEDLRLVTLGTPHHGVPLSNPDWVDIIKANNPILAQFAPTLETFTGLYLNKQGVLDMAWDDYDGLTPDAAKKSDSAFLTKLNAGFSTYAAQTSQKYVLYGGYSTSWPNSFFQILISPKDQQVQYTVAGFGLARLIVSGSDVFAGSDGIVPLASSLYLTAPSGPDDIPARITNDNGNTSSNYQVQLEADVVAAHKPAVKEDRVFKDTLNYQYPISADVTSQLKTELRLEELATGDLNGNGSVSIAEATKCLQYSVGLGTPTFSELLAADLDRDGKISIAETIRVLNLAIGGSTL